MRYTVASGVQNQMSDKFSDSMRYILPLIAVFLAAIYLGLNQGNNLHKVQKPVTLGIYTIKSPDNSSGNSSNGTGNSSTNPTAQNSPSGTSFSPISSGSPNGLASSTYVGGFGANPASTTSSSPAAVVPAAPTSTGIIVCDNSGSLVPITCTATQCVGTVNLLAGQKALLYTNGTCVAIDP